MKDMNGLQQLLDFIHRLREHKVHFTLDCVRDAIMVVVPAPSQYFEIEFFVDGHVETQRFGPAGPVQSGSIDEVTAAVVNAVNGT
jgi:hypothetical protein